MPAKIRPAVAGDENLLAELNSFVQELHVTNRPRHFKRAAHEEVAAWFRGLLEKPTIHVWIAELEGTPVGYVSVFLHERGETPFSCARRWLELDQIGVRPEYRRRGIGRRLIDQVLQSARDQQIRDVELTSWCFNEAAQAAFRHCGFVPKYVRFGQEC